LRDALPIYARYPPADHAPTLPRSQRQRQLPTPDRVELMLGAAAREAPDGRAACRMSEHNVAMLQRGEFDGLDDQQIAGAYALLGQVVARHRNQPGPM